MRQVNVSGIPGRRFRGVTANALAEESELKPEVVPISAGDVPGVIPPFRLIIGVIEVVARKLVVVTRQRGLELSETRADRRNREHPGYDSTLHEQPRADSGARRSMQGRSRTPRLPGKPPSMPPGEPLPASESGSSNRRIVC